MKKVLFVLASFLILSVSSLAVLETINYGDFVGIDLKFMGVTEQSDTDPLGTDGLYGAPTLVGDSLEFYALNFFSSSQYAISNQPMSDITDGKLMGTIEAKPNHFLSSVDFSERGDFTVIGNPGTDFAYAAISNSVNIQILEVENSEGQRIAVDGGADISDVFTMTMEIGGSVWDGDWFLNPDGLAFGTVWSGAWDVDVTAMLVGTAYEGMYVTKATFDMDNTLNTYAGNAGTSSYIAKKITDGLDPTVTVTPHMDPVPEPATLALLGLGALFLRRKK